jgi:hypothetical protein
VGSNVLSKQQLAEVGNIASERSEASAVMAFAAGGDSKDSKFGNMESLSVHATIAI